MLFKSLIFTCFLLLVYTWYAAKMPLMFTQGQHQWQDNVIRAQKYLYSDTVPDNVIIGSSLSCRITDAHLPPSFYKLTFGGQGIIDGLNVIMHHRKFPKTVFIELNMIERGPNSDFAVTLFAPGLFEIRRSILPLQDAYQPSNLFSGKVAHTLGKYVYEPIAANTVNRILKKCITTQPSISNSGVSQKMSNEQEIRYSILGDSVLMHQNLAILQQQMLTLAQNGTQFVFFEMPMSQALEYSVKQQQIRKLFEQYFPAAKYVYLKKPEYKNYVTTDGLHLGVEAAYAYTQFFISEAKTLR